MKRRDQDFSMFYHILELYVVQICVYFELFILSYMLRKR